MASARTRARLGTMRMGICLWEDRASAENYYARAMAAMTEQMGVEPEVSFLDTPVVVDYASGEVIVRQPIKGG